MTMATDRQPERLVLRNQLSELPQLSRWIEACTSRGVSSDVAFAVALCLEEAVVNIIMHGGGAGDQREIIVELARDEHGALTAQIEDDGPEFDPTKVIPPPPSTSLKDAKVGDLGIHLIRSFASEVHYQRAQNRNQLTLRFVAEAMSPR